MKKYDVTIGNKTYKADEGSNLLSFLRDKNIEISAPCNGNKTCRNCMVTVNGKKLLACDTVIDQNLSIEPPDRKMQISDDFKIDGESEYSEQDYAIAIDIGSTTVALALIDLQKKSVAEKMSFVNPQTSYGADALSRLNAPPEKMRGLIVSRLIEALEKMAGDKKIKRIAIAGNTIMIHLLLGLSCENLGVYPFKINAKLKNPYTFEEVFTSGLLQADVYIFPWISAFVGGDITAGLMYIEPCEDFLFIDLGTNAEIVVKNKDKLYCTSVAAGPAFEGGNISRGIAAVEGAVESVTFESGKFICGTIGGAAATGICGSGLVDAVACLFHGGLMDRDGLLADEYFEEGVMLTENVFLTQKDIREFQLAKSAVRSGIEIMLKKSGAQTLPKIYISGGFRLNVENAVITGVLPKGCNVEFIGNSALGGCARLLMKGVVPTAPPAVDIRLSETEEFNDLFVGYLDFRD